MANNRPTEKLEFHILQSERPLRIEASPGRSSNLVVCFSSVGTTKDQYPPKEFVALASQSGENHVISVSDISRSWMNYAGMDDQIQSAISDYVLEHRITSVMSIGASMGAYNALLLGNLMPLARVVAFTPQYSVHPDIVPDETRWQRFRKKIVTWPYAELKKLPGKPTKIFMFHGDSSDEQMHWSRFPTPKNLQHFIFAGYDHNFLGHLRATKQLHKVVAACLNSKVGEASLVFKHIGAQARGDYEDFAAAGTYSQKPSSPSVISKLNETLS